MEKQLQVWALKYSKYTGIGHSSYLGCWHNTRVLEKNGGPIVWCPAPLCVRKIKTESMRQGTRLGGPNMLSIVLSNILI